jgi:hypothetical protein
VRVWNDGVTEDQKNEASALFAERRQVAGAKREAKRAAQREERLSQAASKADAILDQDPQLARAFKNPHGNAFIDNVKAQVYKTGRISEKQTSAVIAAAERDVEYAKKRAGWAAERRLEQSKDAPIPTTLLEGRVTITGVVLRLKDTSLIVRDDRGFRIWLRPYGFERWETVTNPLKQGCRVQFDCRINRSDEDRCFGFAKRPTKHQVLGETS